MEGSQMTGINLRVATLKNAKLKNCNLRGATLAGTDLEVSCVCRMRLSLKTVRLTQLEIQIIHCSFLKKKKKQVLVYLSPFRHKASHILHLQKHLITLKWLGKQ